MIRTVALLAVVAALAGCGGDDDGDSAAPPAEVITQTTAPPVETGGSTTQGDAPVDGREVFLQNCSGCHTLADAGTTGKVGPNLDEAKPPAELVVDRVTHGKGAMPSFEGQLSDEQIADVAAYVSSVAGSA